MPETVYLETTFISYLTARPSRNLVRAGQQRVTLDWWSTRRDRYQVYASDLVVVEASAGDPVAAGERLELLKTLQLLPAIDEAQTVARALLDHGAIPPTEPRDALHIGLCAVHKIDYLLTWNFKHLANAHMVRKIERAIESTGHAVPMICTPEFLME